MRPIVFIMHIVLFLDLSALLARSPKDGWACWDSISLNMFSTGQDAGNGKETKKVRGRMG